MRPTHIASILWLLWYAAWGLAATWSDRPAKRLGRHREAPSRMLTGIGVVLLFFYNPAHMGRDRVLWDPPGALAWSLLVPVALGFLFAAWARIHLGRLWSPHITRKPEHRIVDTGPYGLVRHPIYSGLILSACATAAMQGVLSAVLGAITFTLGFYLKARLEERFLRDELGPAYDAYARRVGMLVPSGGR
jgi:protein-S-isoprenylcysteine O-methyltransferase Ste14